MGRYLLYRIAAILLMAGCIIVIKQYHQSYYNAQALTKTFESQLNTVEHDVANTLVDQQLFLKLLKSLEEKQKLSNDLLLELQKLASKSYTIYLYSEDSLVYWSQPGLVIEPKFLNLKAFPGVFSDHRSDYLIKKYLLKDQEETYTAFAKIPILPHEGNNLNVSITALTLQNKFERISTATTIHSIEGDAVCEIKVIGTSYPRLSQYALILLGIFIFVLLSNLLINGLGHLKNWAGNFNSALLQIGGVILLRILSFLIPYHNQFEELSIVQSLFENQDFSYALIDFVLDASIVLWIASHVCKMLSGSINLEKEKKWIIHLNSIGNYLILILITGLLSWMMRSVIISSNLNLDLENISFFNYRHFICIISFGLITLSALVVVHELIRQNIRLIPNLYTRLGHLVSAGLISLPILDMIPIGASLFGFFLAAFISSTLLDLFIEKGTRSVIWVITWLIAISGFSSVLLYKYQQDNDLLRRVETLRSIEQMIFEEPDDLNQRILEWYPHSISPKYSLAIYKNDQMVFNYKYDYPLVLTDELRPATNDVSERQIKNRNEVSLASKNDIWLFAGKPLEGPMGVISLFSYIFTIYSILLFIIALINSLATFLPSNFNVSFSSKLTLKNKIQLAIVFIILLTFIIIGLVTVFYMRSSSQLDLDRRYEDKLQTLSTSLNETNPNETKNGAIAQAANIAYANNRFSKIYDQNGNLIFRTATYSNNSAPPPLKISFISKMILDYSNRDFTLERDRTKTNSYTIGYIGLKDQQEMPLGYVEFPNSNILNEQDDPGAHIFSTLLNAYVFLFLIAVALAIAIANSITRPLSQLSEKMKKTRLGKKNEVITWNNEDEIGDLINDYNGMILKLDESAKMLAQSERDIAWREMAKQVAHEIKNPLTPMKLSIQYLQNAIKQRKGDITEMAGRVSHTLIEQIDNLANIATEFSNFAKMPTSNHERVILNEIVESIHDLFRKRDDMDIQLYVPINEIIVFADKNQLLRVLNNLMKNAMQAIPDSRRGKIDIILDRQGDQGVIEVRDNGVGIPEDMQEQVFYPNFTTKSSGTGLGLAMSSNIIDACDGRLYFETEVDKGSTFFIILPLMKIEQVKELQP